MVNFMICSIKCGCLRIANISVDIKCSLIIQLLCGIASRNCYRMSIPLYEAISDFDIRAGFIARMKNIQFYLFLQKPLMSQTCLISSERKFQMGLNYPLSPLTRMCARYLHQLERSATDSLGERLKYFIMVSMKSQRREEESEISLFGLILEISTSATDKSWHTLFLIFGMVVLELSQYLVDNIMTSINNLIFLILTDSDVDFLQLVTKSSYILH